VDSLTQLTLGAAVGEATLGRRVGRAAALWGAALGTLPDLDVFANPFLTDVEALWVHRGLTHSLVFMLALTPVGGWLLHRLHPDGSRGRWAALTFLALATHVFIDCLTSYGTQVFFPFDRTPVILGTIFVIDPLYTVPLLGGLVAALRYDRADRRRRFLNTAGLVVSSLYLLVTVGNKMHVGRVMDAALARAGIDAERTFTRPTPFNNVLWTGLAETDDAFHLGYYSLLDDDRRIRFARIPKRHDLLPEGAEDAFAVQTLRWFSRGYFAVRRTPDGGLVIHDLRFGRSDLAPERDGDDDAGYVFSFRLTRGPGGRIAGFERQRPRPPSADDLRRFWARLTGDERRPAPTATTLLVEAAAAPPARRSTLRGRP
jgi:inner membrane protein